MYYVYILECSDKTLYTWITTDLERRIIEHNSWIWAKYTSWRTPVKLVYKCEFENRSLASKEEVRIKKLNRKDKIYLLRNKS